MENCDFYDNGRCKKSSTRRKCENCVSNETWFSSEFQKCNIDEVCRYSSIFGNRYYTITDEDIDDMRQGKVLTSVDEYGTFIRLKKEWNDNMESENKCYENDADAEKGMREIKKKIMAQKVDVLAVLLGAEMDQHITLLRANGISDEIIYNTVLDLICNVAKGEK